MNGLTGLKTRQLLRGGIKAMCLVDVVFQRSNCRSIAGFLRASLAFDQQIFYDGRAVNWAHELPEKQEMKMGDLQTHATGRKKESGAATPTRRVAGRLYISILPAGTRVMLAETRTHGFGLVAICGTTVLLWGQSWSVLACDNVVASLENVLCDMQFDKTSQMPRKT